MIFTPKREDGRPVWRVIYDYLVGKMDDGSLKVGDIIKHKDLRDLLTDEEREYYYANVGRSARELREARKRSLQSMRGAGYRLIAGVSQSEQGQAQTKRARRSLNKGLQIATTADRALMSPEDRTWADKVQNGMVALAMIARQHDERLIALGEQMEDLKTTQIKSSLQLQATDAELNEIRQRLADIERRKR